MTTPNASHAPSASPNGDRWYSEWFNEDYAALYAHRDTCEAQTLVELIDSRLRDLPAGNTLDLACGAGRHLPFLSKRQPTTGLDLSPWLLDMARERNPGATLVRADMRDLPFADNSFTLVASLFTSFGYFCGDDENLRVLSQVARVCAPGGWFVLDFLNAPNTRKTLVPYDRSLRAGRWIEQRRRISSDGRFVQKSIRLESSGREFMERVRLFEPGELSQMLESAGFRTAAIYGDYRGGKWSASSPRTILLAQRLGVNDRKPLLEIVR